MASLKFLIVTAILTVGAHAKFAWQHNDDFPAFPKIRMPVPPTPPFHFAPIPPFAPFAPFPPFGPGFGQFQNFNQFPNFPHIPLPVVPTPDQIRNVQPGPGQVFSGMAVRSGSSFTRDKDGNIIRTGGTSVISNDNGEVLEFKQGNAPPNINEPINIPPIPKLEPLKFPSFHKMKPLEFPEFKMPVFKPLKFDPIKPIDEEEMKTRVPKEGETYVGTSISSSSNSKTVNGKTVASGASSVLVNDNGKTQEEVAAFHLGDKDFVEQ